MLLLAAPLPPPPPVVAIDQTTLIIAAVIIGLPIATRLFLDFFKWSAARNVQHEDQQKARLEQKVDTLSKDVGMLEKKVDNAMTAFNTFTGQLTALDNRIAKQGESWEKKLDEGLAEVTTELNRKLTQTMHNELPHIVREELARSRRE